MDNHFPPPPLSFPPKEKPCHVGNLPISHEKSRINGCDHLKEAQGPWMAGIKTLESLTEEKHFARLK
ncbi:hypothetical protein Tco_1432271, partial [Tanacetum coccineum]